MTDGSSVGSGHSITYRPVGLLCSAPKTNTTLHVSILKKFLKINCSYKGEGLGTLRADKGIPYLVPKPGEGLSEEVRVD